MSSPLASMQASASGAASDVSALPTWLKGAGVVLIAGLIVLVVLFATRKCDAPSYDVANGKTFLYTAYVQGQSYTLGTGVADAKSCKALCDHKGYDKCKAWRWGPSNDGLTAAATCFGLSSMPPPQAAVPSAKYAVGWSVKQ